MSSSFLFEIQLGTVEGPQSLQNTVLALVSVKENTIISAMFWFDPSLRAAFNITLEGSSKKKLVTRILNQICVGTNVEVLVSRYNLQLGNN